MRPYIPEMKKADNLCPKKEGRGGPTSTEDSIDTSIRRLEDYIKKIKERLITAIKRTAVTKRKMGRKTFALIFQATNKRNLTREDLDIAKKEKL